MLTCPSCRSVNPAGVVACLACGGPVAAPAGDGPGAVTVVDRRDRTDGYDDTPAAPRAALQTPLPDDGASASGSALSRLLQHAVPDSDASATFADDDDDPSSACTIREPVGRGSGKALATAVSPSLRGEPSDAVPVSPRAAAPAPAPLQPRLVVVRGERVNATYRILEGRNLIGRSADRSVDIDLGGQEPVEQIWTSRQHAVVVFEHGVLTIEDLNSLNGTFVNQTRIRAGQQRVLQPGDVVQVGTVQLKVLA